MASSELSVLATCTTRRPASLTACAPATSPASSSTSSAHLAPPSSTSCATSTDLWPRPRLPERILGHRSGGPQLAADVLDDLAALEDDLHGIGVVEQLGVLQGVAGEDGEVGALVLGDGADAIVDAHELGVGAGGGHQRG